MKRKLVLIATVVCALALMLSVGVTAFAETGPGITHNLDYSNAFERVFNGTTQEADMTAERLETDTTGEDGVTIPAGSVHLRAGNRADGDVNYFVTASKVINMQKPVVIKWRERFTGDMVQYYIGLSTDKQAVGDPLATEFSFDQTWGSAYNNTGTMKSTFRSKGAVIGAWDLGTGEHQLSRGRYYFYQVKIEYNAETAAYDVTMSFEGHDGSNKATLASCSVQLDPALFAGGAHLYVYGSSHQSVPFDLDLVADTRADHLEGTNFGDWFHSATVTDAAGLQEALADTSVSSIDCKVSDKFKMIEEEIVIERSLTIVCMDVNGVIENAYGTGGLIFTKGLTVRGGVVFGLTGGAVRTAVVIGATARFDVVSLGWTEDMTNDKPAHCVVMEDGAHVTATWASLDVSGRGALSLSGGSTFVAAGNADTIYKATSFVDVPVEYNGIIPTIFCTNKGVASIYAVCYGEGNKLEGFETLAQPLVEYATAENGTFYIQYAPIEGFGFDLTEINVAVGGVQEGSLDSVSPEIPTNVTALSYAIEDETIAEVAAVNQNLGFKVTGKQPGTTNLIVRTTDRLNPEDAVTGTIPVTVTAPQEVGFEVDESGFAGTIEEGGSFDFSKLVVRAVMSDGSKVTLSASDYTVDASGVDTAKAGEYTVRVTYKEYEAHTITVMVEASADSGKSCVSNATAPTALGAAAAFAVVAVLVLKKRKA